MARRMTDIMYPRYTTRLSVRPFVEDDFEALYAIQSRADVTRFLYWEPHSREVVAQALAARLHSTTLETEGQVLRLAVALGASGAVIGEVDLHFISAEHGGGEIGFVFHPDYHGHGYAREAAAEMLKIGFETCRLHRIVGRCDARNVASAHLMERLGMRREAHFLSNKFVKGEWCDEYVYALLAEEWLALA